MRLIDADALKDTLCEVMDKYDGYDPDDGKIIQGLMEADELINTALTIEAAPVVHGRWEVHDHPYIKPRQDGWICTSCSFVTEDIANGDTNYCPNCGARMDGDGNA